MKENLLRPKRGHTHAAIDVCPFRFLTAADCDFNAAERRKSAARSESLTDLEVLYNMLTILKGSLI